jgi:hypothetical protein
MNPAKRGFVTLLLAAIGAVGLAVAVFAPAAKAEFLCEYDTTGESDNGFTDWHMLHAQNIATYYGFRLSEFGPLGPAELHEPLREAVSNLELDPLRTPLINADMNTGRIHVSYCAETRCTNKERHAADRACLVELSAPCILYAIRIDGITLCLLSPWEWLRGRQDFPRW